MTFPIQSYIPRLEKKWKADEDGSFSAEVYTAYGVVGFFTYPSGRHGEAFTKMEIFIGLGVQQNGVVYHVRLPRSYSRAWVRRLCFDFAEQAHRQHEGRIA